ncbi:hypothetical protein BDB01DRAFT_892935 [Pilobolus umbonatus]|nr:hypothetical protein BDB01DRAFT_892935 [Pilobolus umbonatus]
MVMWILAGYPYWSSAMSDTMNTTTDTIGTTNAGAIDYQVSTNFLFDMKISHPEVYPLADTQPISPKEQVILARLDMRISLIDSFYGDYARKANPTKFYQDRLKMVLGAKAYVNLIIRYSKISHRLYVQKEVPLRDHSGGRPKCSHPLKSVEELTGVVVVIMLGGVISGILPTTFGIRWLLTSRWLILLIEYFSVLEN